MMIDIFKSIHIPSQTIGELKIGPLCLWLRNLPDEWRLCWTHKEDPSHENIQDLQFLNSDKELSLPGSELRRFGFKEKSNDLVISPMLSDRSIVVRPDNPLLVPGGEKVGFVLSTPLWLKIVDQGQGCFLTEIPTHRPSDTWFGESPVEGELCYLTRTAARLRIQELPFRYHRAVTMVSISNLGRRPLAVDRFKIPMRNLTLYRSSTGWFFTESLSYDWEGEKDEIKMFFQGQPVLPDVDLIKISEPREPLESNLVIRTFKSLLRS